jgi:thyroxine 5-deiodinase
LLVIYIEEAHAVDEWWLPDARGAQEGGRACIKCHTSEPERVEAALAFQADLAPFAEVVCDSMANEVCERLDAWPERLFVVLEGVVVYQGGYGPFDYSLDELEAWLNAYSNNANAE